MNQDEIIEHIKKRLEAQANEIHQHQMELNALLKHWRNAGRMMRAWDTAELIVRLRPNTHAMAILDVPGGALELTREDEQRIREIVFDALDTHYKNTKEALFTFCGKHDGFEPIDPDAGEE